MLIGYVSDEMDIAIADAQLELIGADGASLEVRSRSSGAVHADVSPGRWRIILTAPGHGRKWLDMDVTSDLAPVRFRLQSDRLLGYAWPKWARAGDQVELRVHSPEPYFASLWRYGWEKEQVLEIGRFESFGPGGDRQILPDGDISATGVAWNHGARRFPPSDQSFITAPDRTGLYYVHLEGLETGEFFSFPLIVAPAEQPPQRIAVLCSNLDWNAYNDYGGRSNYVAAWGLPATPVLNPHQDGPYLRDTGGRFWDREDYDPLSLDRPEPVNRTEPDASVLDVMTRIGEEHVAPGTWRILGWLEREGFGHDVWAETQLHSGELDLDRYSLLILDQHPEYWTRDMYFRVKTWVDERGGKLMYLGGNGINCEVTIDGHQVTHHDTDASEFIARRSYLPGPDSEMPSRFSKRVENEATLLGVSTTLTGMGTGAPYAVIDADHWAFEGTGLEVGDLFGLGWLDARNPGGASGHETDKRNASTPAGTRLVARGTNANEGGAELVTYETASGGEVYSVGSISYGASMIVDDVLTHITSNVIRHLLR